MLFLFFLNKHHNTIGHIIGIFAILLLLPSCQKEKDNRTPLQIEQHITWEKMQPFLDKIPIKNVDSTITLIKQLKTPLEREMVYRKIIGEDNIEPKNIFRYFDYMEPRLREENIQILGYMFAKKGSIYAQMGKIDSSFYFAQKGLHLQKKGKDSLVTCKVYFDLSNLYLMQDFALSATEICTEGLKYIPKRAKISDIQGANKMLKHNLLVSYRKQRNYEKTTEIVRELIQIATQEKDSMSLVHFYTNLGVVYAKTNQKDSALWAGKIATEIFQAYPKRDESENTSLAFAFLWRECKEYDKALEYAEKTRQISLNSNNRTYLAKALFSLGHIHLAKGKLAEAEKYYRQILADSTLPKTLNFKRDVADSLLVLELKKQNKQQLLTEFYTARKLSDSLARREDKRILNDMNVRYETSERENKIRELALEKKVWRNQTLIASLLLFLVLGFASVWLYRNRQKRLLLEKQKMILEIQKEIQAKEISENKMQLQKFNESIIAKNSLIEEMQQQLDIILEKASCIPQNEIESNKEAFNSLKILTENDWKNYLVYFEKAKPNFIERIKLSFPSLTQGDLRLFLLMNLGFHREQIADILGISPDSVRKNQYRLRKKVGQEGDKELEEFILNF